MDIHYYLIINEKAGGGKGKTTAHYIIQQLHLQNKPFTLLYTQVADHERSLVQTLAETTLIPWTNTLSDQVYPLLVILGGDGTLHNALNALQGYSSSIPLGYIPCGSGNDFARGASISRKPQKALAQLLNAAFPQELHTINYKERIQQQTGTAMNNLGIGLDAKIVQVTNASSTKKKLRQLKLESAAYIFSILNVLFTEPGFPILVEVNGKMKQFDRAFLCTITNHPYFGGGVAIAPTANIKKTSLDLVLVEKTNVFHLFTLLFLLLRKKHLQAKAVHHFQAKKIRVVSTTPQPIHADGELLGAQPIDSQFETKTNLFWFVMP